MRTIEMCYPQNYDSEDQNDYDDGDRRLEEYAAISDSKDSF
jgi:hypothetical protein